MSIYRKKWTDQKGTGWVYQLDIIPFGSSLDYPVVNLSGNDVVVTELGTITSKFDGLPYGLKAPDQMTIKIAISNLPSALQTALRLKKDPSNNARNTFLFYTNRGIGTNPVYLEFAGTPSKISGISYKQEAGVWLTEIELVDILYDSMISTPMSDLQSVATSGTRITKFTDIPDFRFLNSDSVSIQHKADSLSTGFSSGFWINSFENMVGYVFQNVSDLMAIRYCHQVDGPKIADYYDLAASFIGKTITYFKRASAYPSTKSTALTSSTAMLPSHVFDRYQNQLIGGMFAPQDEVGWAKYENAWDWYKDLCECMAAKVNFYPTIATISGASYIAYSFDVLPVLSDWSGSPNVIAIERSLEWPEIAETDDGIGKVEVRTQTFRNTDVKEFKINTGVMRADKQFTSQIMLHNLPVMVNDEYDTDEDNDYLHFYSPGLFQTNRFCWKVTSANDEVELVHPTVRIYSDTSSYVDYEAVVDGDDIGSKIAKVQEGDTEIQQLQLYVNGVQGYGCTPRAIAQFIADNFGSDDIASFSIKFRITDYPTLIRNVNLGGVYDMSASTIASEFAHLNWSKAISTEVECDYSNNTAKIKFILMP